MSTKQPTTITDIQAAARRLRGVVTHTPLLPAVDLGARLGRPVFIKPEALQCTGSFKFRGAYNRIAALEPAVRKCGVVAFSSGNHAQGVAAAAQLHGIASTIVMPTDAPKAKVAGTRAWGAAIVFYDRETESREAIAERLAIQQGATLIPSFDDPHVIAGQGTIGLEIATAVAAHGLMLDAIATPVGGGGLAGGIAIAVGTAAPGCKVFGAEPAGFDDAARSFAEGRIVENARKSGSTQDALLSPHLSDLTFGILRNRIGGMAAVTDDEATAACRYAAAQFKLIVEPGGAAALAAVLHGRLPASDGALVIVVSGGNADLPS